MFQFMSPTLPKVNREMSEIERFRARHRRLCRGQQQTTASAASIEALDVDDGRARKISVKWQQKQQQAQLRNHLEDGIWPKSAGTEMHLGFNAFDFSSSPEAFYDDPEEFLAPKGISCDVIEQDLDAPYAEQLLMLTDPIYADDEAQKQKQHMAEVGKQVTAMGFNSASLWERSFPGLRQPGGPIRQLPAVNQRALPQSLWRPPVHYATYDDQRRAFYYPSQYYA